MNAICGAYESHLLFVYSSGLKFKQIMISNYIFSSDTDGVLRVC